MINTHQKVRTAVPHVLPHPAQPVGDRELRLANQAARWAAFARSHCRLRSENVNRKALESLQFSIVCGARDLAIPSKLSGTSRYQEALRTVHELHPLRGHRLSVTRVGDQLQVSFADVMLGRVQNKHLGWLIPLLEHGTGIHLLQVTGTDCPDHWLGMNIAFSRVAPAIDRFSMASSSGDGAPTGTDSGDIVLWRSPGGTARANVMHLVRHSPTGFEWGYHGSGPADLARSVLLRFVGRETADRLYQLFKHDIIASIPREGGLIEAALIRSWLSEHQNG